MHLPNLLGSHSTAILFFYSLDVTPFTFRCTSGGGSSDDDKDQGTTQDAHAVLGCGVVQRSSATGSSALAWRTTHLTWFPTNHAQPAETHSPGATWRRSVPIWGYPDLALAYFTSLPCRPFRQTGLARGGVRRGATKSSHRDGTGCDLRRCGGALPFPHTVTHFSRISIGISFLLSIKPPPSLSFRGFGVGCVTRTSLGWPRAGSVISSTLALAHRLGGGFTPPTKQSSKANHRRDNNSQAHQGCHLLATA